MPMGNIFSYLNNIIHNDNQVNTVTNNIPLITILSDLTCSTIGLYITKQIIINHIQYKKFYINSKYKKQIIINIVAIIHSLILTLYGFKKCFFPYNYWYNTLGSYSIMTFTCSYFIQDLINLEFKYSNISFIVHHILAILLVFTSIYTKEVHHLIAPFSLVELSSVFLNIGYVLQLLNKKNSFIYKLNYVVFMQTFFITRIIWMPFLIYKFIFYKNISEVKYAEWCITFLASLNIFWFKYIVQKGIKIIKN